jgi:hypothetical protein
MTPAVFGVQRQQEQERSRKVHVMDEEELRLLASGDQTVTHLPGNQCCGSGIRCLFEPGSGIGFFSKTRIPNPYFL